MKKETSRTEFEWYDFIWTDEYSKLAIMQDKHGQIFNIPIEECEFSE